LTLSSTLDVSASNYGITLSGSWINNGTFTSQSGKVTFAGTVAQTISGSSTTSFYDVDISNTGGVTCSSAQQLQDNLNLVGSGKFNANGLFTLLSTSSRTANIAILVTPANFTGNITMQRYSPGGLTGWVLLGAPITGTTMTQWDDNTYIACPSGCPDGAAGSFYSIYTYNESTLGTKDKGFVNFTNVNDAITAGKGYFFYMGTGGLNTSAITMDVTGAPVKGNFNFGVTYTNDVSQPATENGWNLVANPYPCVIDWSSASFTKTNVNNAIYIYNADLAQYASFVGGVGTNGGSRYIPSSQGFYVQTNAASPVLSCTENIKVTNQQPTFFKIKADSIYEPVLRINAAGNTFTDEIAIHITPDATDTFDTNYDAVKFLSDNPAGINLSSITKNVEYTINSLTADNDVYIPVKFVVGTAGTYTFNFNGAENFTNNNTVVFEDLSSGSKYDLKSIFNYSFYISDTVTAPRFLIHISKNIATGIQEIQTNKQSVEHFALGNGTGIVRFDDDFEGDAVIHFYDLLGRELINPIPVNKGQRSIKYNLPSNNSLYIVSVETGHGRYCFKGM